jgi:S-adenosylmethionine:tRNA ribosyltransferase-isomerase
MRMTGSHRVLAQAALLSGSWPDFHIPPEREASAPPEACGVPRDGVRLLVAWRSCGCVAHGSFRAMPGYLEPGDVLVVNTSRTLPAALPATTTDGRQVLLHFSTRLPGGDWVVELRRRLEDGGRSLPGCRPGDQVRLPGGYSAVLQAPYADGGRLWVAMTDVRQGWLEYLLGHGRPIRYSHVARDWPLSCYQTIFANEWGSAEMPSAARPFTPAVLRELERRGIDIAPLVLHSGVSSLEVGEPPQAEYFSITEATAERVNRAKLSGARVIAVGTTVVRALESCTGEDLLVRARNGWTTRLVSPESPPVVATGLVTGFHEPRGTHLELVEAFLGRAGLLRTYAEAVREGYLWHEFGDVQLVLPNGHCQADQLTEGSACHSH